MLTRAICNLQQNRKIQARFIDYCMKLGTTYCSLSLIHDVWTICLICHEQYFIKRLYQRKYSQGAKGANPLLNLNITISNHLSIITHKNITLRLAVKNTKDTIISRFCSWWFLSSAYKQTLCECLKINSYFQKQELCKYIVWLWELNRSIKRKKFILIVLFQNAYLSDDNNLICQVSKLE